MTRSLAIITARGGSKRIPKKNIKEFCGKPIIAYSIQAAKKSNLFDEVMVSTDDDVIKEVALKYGAKTPFIRSEKNSNDYATTVDVIFEVLQKYAELENLFDYACCIYPTAPFITPNKLCNAYNLLLKENCDSVFPATTFTYPPQRGLIRNNENVSWWLPQYKDSRSQDLEKIYHDAGQFYFFDVKKFLKNSELIGNKSRMILIPEIEAQDIDNYMDWELAEMKYLRMISLNNEKQQDNV